MAGRNHEFLLLQDRGDRRQQVLEHINDGAAICIHDDLLGYMSDTLSWIPTENPARPGDGRVSGLKWCGVAAIDGEGAALASRILGLWADPFACGPETLELTGDHGVGRGRTGGERRIRAHPGLA